jgi:hypothetical protein
MKDAICALPLPEATPDPRDEIRRELIEHLDRQIEHAKENSASLIAWEADYPDNRRPSEGRCRERAGQYLEEVRMLFAGWPEKPIPLPSPDPRDALLALAKEALIHVRETIDAVDHVIPDWAKEESVAIHEAGIVVTEAIAAIEEDNNGTDQ